MSTKIDDILFLNDTETYDILQTMAEGFSANYVGDNILQTNIFSVVENYVRIKGTPIEFISFPVSDKHMTAFSYVKNRRIISWYNANIMPAEQIMAVAQELYYYVKLLEDGNEKLTSEGIILTKEQAKTEEEVEAETFARLFLVRPDALAQQCRIFGIKKDSVEVKEIITLMELFAATYETVVIRLFETGYISKETAQTYLNFNPKDINGYIDLTGKAKRWHTIDPTRTLWGSLPENLLRNSQNYTLSEERIEKENEKFAKIKERCRELFIC